MIISPPKRGMALAVVLVLLAVMMLVTITLSARMQQQLGRTRSQQEYQQALWYSASAESLALSALSLSLKNEKRVHLAQPWASGPRFFPLPQGQIAVTLRDAQACFNLNALAQPTTATRPLAVQQLIALITRLDVPAYRAELIAESLWSLLTRTAAYRHVWAVKTASISPVRCRSTLPISRWPISAKCAWYREWTPGFIKN
ncbi:type II secretion system protein K [Escherichia coli]|uniref:Type II secretion system protein K n=1 Tax=Escherichia coli TaxID=562 RepID=A0A447X3S2_ECOLX|nr:type II secretion system protein K [Escherichia coli]